MNYVTGAIGQGVDKVIGVFLPGWDAPTAESYTVTDAIKDTFIPDGLLSTPEQPLVTPKKNQFPLLTENVQNALFLKKCSEGRLSVVSYYLTQRKFDKSTIKKGISLAKQNKHKTLVKILNEELSEREPSKKNGNEGKMKDSACKCIIL
jgi:hypothetical protein